MSSLMRHCAATESILLPDWAPGVNSTAEKAMVCKRTSVKLIQTDPRVPLHSSTNSAVSLLLPPRNFNCPRARAVANAILARKQGFPRLYEVLGKQTDIPLCVGRFKKIRDFGNWDVSVRWEISCMMRPASFVCGRTEADGDCINYINISN